ncbi:Uu.00g077610.m01.CDS01 [Anthostomella pinea]|uniref:Uu.00g077610.m01.CDS01 n=1 Tax=Anthostomella pinea TaxID=933095 RepID=A0AAI8VW34_9PEZI|nr:Uu.00g077610.m01.CDS01 [Anthostomella pinea]
MRSMKPAQSLQSRGFAQSRGAQPQTNGPTSVRAYIHQVRSFLGKRKSEDDHEPIAAPDYPPPDMDDDEPCDSAKDGDSDGNSEVWDDWGSPEHLDGDDALSIDGTVDRSKKRKKAPVSAVFIHAGAGYHSTANERVHLEACREAARVSMRLLKGGHTAVDAVEAAIKVLEDKEITNAGYGSNLAIDGTVECDATLVDHLGRSGACGAVPNIKNPISLAKTILESSNKPLSLRRVPPNLLVANGAKDFAWESGMALVPNEWLVSKNARDRYVRWQEDLRRAEGKGPTATVTVTSSEDVEPARREHTSAILMGTWNEGQPDSPATSSPSWRSTPQMPRSPMSPGTGLTSQPSARGTPDTSRSPLSFLGSKVMTTVSSKRQRFASAQSNDAEKSDSITDTVGAIAIDQQGHLAAGSSSGGIGMKHRGRVGPAALVGIGTAVIPPDSKDRDGVSVAAVTSGTGEHMATTMASQKCAERIYHQTRRGPGGQDVEEPDEREVLESFVFNDFQEHPGVKNSCSAGAIGVMAVKKGPRGFYLYFAHNTDSFALASMGSNDRDPACVMSRIIEGGNGIAQGALKIDV